MLYLARSSPKLCRLSRAPSALIFTLIPGADFCCARAIKLASPLESGLNENELRKAAATANMQSKIAPPMSLYSLTLFICHDGCGPADKAIQLPRPW